MDVVMMKVAGDSAGQDTLANCALSHFPGKAAGSVADVQADTTINRLRDLRQHSSATVQDSPGLHLIHVGHDVVLLEPLQNLRERSMRAANVYHDRETHRVGSLTR